MKSIPKRKTTTSSEVKARWNAKTYKHYQAYFRKEEDAELIEYIENRKKGGTNTSDIFRESIEMLKNEG